MSRNVDGMIILPPPHAKSVLSSISRFNVPVVLLGRDVPSFNKAGRVLIDNYLSVKLELDELYGSGYRNIQVITSDMEISSIVDKVSAYKTLMSEYGLEKQTAVHYISTSDSDEKVVETIVNARKSGAEAFLLLSNDTTTRFITAINKIGLHAPQDVAFVGFDKSLIYDFLSTSVTHIVEPQNELATEAARMLLGMMEEGEKPTKVVIRPHLIQGNSSLPVSR